MAPLDIAPYSRKQGPWVSIISSGNIGIQLPICPEKGFGSYFHMTPVYLQFMAAVACGLAMCHCSYSCTCFDQELRSMWLGFCVCPGAIKFDVTHGKMYQVLHLGRENLGKRLACKECGIYRSTKPEPSLWMSSLALLVTKYHWQQLIQY